MSRTPPRSPSPFYAEPSSSSPSHSRTRSLEQRTASPLVQPKRPITPDHRLLANRQINPSPNRSPHISKSTSNSHIRSASSSTTYQAIHTALPATPPQRAISTLYATPPSRNKSGAFEEIELTPTSRGKSRYREGISPFDDSCSIFEPQEKLQDEFIAERDGTPNRQKTMRNYRFAGTSPTPSEEHMEELDFGGNLEEPTYISDKRRSLYPSSIPVATLRDHPDLLSAPGPKPYISNLSRINPIMPPVRARFRGLFTFSTTKDISLYLIPSILLAIAASLPQPFMSIIIGDAFQIIAKYPFITESATEQQRSDLYWDIRRQVILLAGGAAYSLVLNYLRSLWWTWHAEVLTSRLRQKVFEGVSKKDLEWFDTGMGMREGEVEGDEAIGAGGLMAKFTRETDDVRIGTSQVMGQFFQSLSTFILCFILAMIRSPILALVTLATIPLVVLVQIITQVFAAPCYAEERRGMAEASTDAERSTNAIATVKAHNAERSELIRFNRILRRIKVALCGQAVLWGLSFSLSDFLLLATFVSGFWYGAKVVRDGTASSGTVMTVFWAALLAASHLQQTVPCLAAITKAKLSMASLMTIIQDPSSSPPVASPILGDKYISSPMINSSSGIPKSPNPRYSNSMGKIRPTRCHGEFNFKGISFAYPSRVDNLVLRDITLFIPPGETTFIVGGSGSGKSTIAQLLLRSYNPLGGEITLDDQSFTYLDEEFTSENIAAVQQGCILFDMTVHENVALGLAGANVKDHNGKKRRPEDVSRFEVEEACKMAMIHDFIISLPDGYETKLGTGGSNLSGGQRQRLAIARARIRDPPILILDEATSALDATSRVAVFENMKSWRRNKTTIVITHDLSQIVSDDFVYVMKDGIVAEQGFRSDLIRKQPNFGYKGKEGWGIFANMAAEQSVMPLPPKIEIQDIDDVIDIDDYFDFIEDNRSTSRNGGIVGLGRVNTSSFMGRPESLAYFDVLEEYSKGLRNSVILPNLPIPGLNNNDKEKEKKVEGTRRPTLGTNLSVPNGINNSRLSLAQRRLSWAPTELMREGNSRNSIYTNENGMGSKLSVNTRPASRMSRQISFENTNKYGNGNGSNYSHRNSLYTPYGSTERILSRRKSMGLRHQTSSQYMPEKNISDLEIVTPKLMDDNNKTSTERSLKTLGLMKIMKFYLPTIPTKSLFLLGLFGALTHGVLVPVWSFFLTKLMQIIASGGTDPTLTRYALTVLAVSTAQAISSYLQEYALYSTASIWITKIRSIAYQKILNQDKEFFDNEDNSPVMLVQNLMKDTDDLRLLIVSIMGKFVVVISMISLGIIWAIITNWRLTLVGLALAPIFVVVVAGNEMLTGKAEMRNKEKREKVSKLFYESVANVRGIRAMALQSTFREKFEMEARDAENTGRKVGWFVAVGFGMSSAIPLVAVALLNWAGTQFILQNSMTFPNMLQVVNLVLFSLTFAAQSLDFIPMIAKVKAAAHGFNRLYNLGSSTSESSGELRFPITGHISFESVSFTYPSRPDVPILTGISFKLSPGECVAIVGPSGSGKSTISALLQRLYEPQKGYIKMGNDWKYDLSKSDVKWLRDNIAIVSQSANLFDATVAENIAYGNGILSHTSSSSPYGNMRNSKEGGEGEEEQMDGRGIPMNDIYRAAREANIHDFILSLPQGYQTNLGENASLISGGQAQRLQIARALVRRSKVLILDEATSALDVDNQRAILDTIINIKDTRTTLFITHSVEVMRKCDRIICLDDGKVAEDGSYEELISRGGVFTQLMKMGEWE